MQSTYCCLFSATAPPATDLRRLHQGYGASNVFFRSSVASTTCSNRLTCAELVESHHVTHIGALWTANNRFVSCIHAGMCVVRHLLFRPLSSAEQEQTSCNSELCVQQATCLQESYKPAQSEQPKGRNVIGEKGAAGISGGSLHLWAVNSGICRCTADAGSSASSLLMFNIQAIDADRGLAGKTVWVMVPFGQVMGTCWHSRILGSCNLHRST